ncbi:MAG: hypothetical protein ABJP45_07500 [Cyclobacteriaceae bacterium]
MEFEEMQKVWDKQSNEMLFVINENALHKRVKAKKKQANRIVNVTEIGLMIINTATAGILLADAIIDNEGPYDYAGVGIMLLTVVYLLFIRKKRKNQEDKFDRSILGELEHAISNTQSTIQIGKTMIYWYLLPIGIYIIINMIHNEASLSKWLLVAGAFILGNFLGNWEIRNCHIPRKRHLERLREKLME